MKTFFVFLTLCVGLFRCAGYHWENQENPFKRYGIRSLSVPTFVNRSGLPNVAAPITREMILMLSEYPSLKVYSGEKEGVDAILLGIVYSKDHRKDIIKTSERIYIESELNQSIGGRPLFLVPSASSYKLHLQIALVKNPAIGKHLFLKSNLGPSLKSEFKKNSTIAFNKTFLLQGRFKRETRETGTSDSAGLTNFTKTKKYFEQSVDSLAKRAAQMFKETVLNAF